MGWVTVFGYDGFDRLTTTTWPDTSYESLGYAPMATSPRAARGRASRCPHPNDAASGLSCRHDSRRTASRPTSSAS